MIEEVLIAWHKPGLAYEWFYMNGTISLNVMEYLRAHSAKLDASRIQNLDPYQLSLRSLERLVSQAVFLPSRETSL